LCCAAVTVQHRGVTTLRAVDLEVSAGALTVLVGPSGAGKTTLLRTIAGLDRLAGGSIRLHGRQLDVVPAHERCISYVFQTPRLFPNFDVAENVAFPLRVAGVPRDERRRRAARLLEDVGLEGFAARSPRLLSGGEAQRVALARALSGQPDLLLLDEPLAAVDPDRRDELRRLIRRLQRERSLTTIYVTHDRTEAAELGDVVAFMAAGRIAQCGSPQELFERPVSPAVARFFGSSNILRGCLIDGRLHVLASGTGGAQRNGTALFTIRPERVRVIATATRNADLVGTVEEASYLGAAVRLVLRVGEARIEAHVSPEEVPAVGARVGVHLPAERLWRFPDYDDGSDGRRTAVAVEGDKLR